MRNWLPVLFFGALLAIPEARQFFVLRWTPYSSLEFFLVMVPSFAAIGLFKGILKSERRWISALQIINLIYLLLIFPQPVPLLFAAFWFYAILKWREKRKTVWQGILLLLPLLVKHNVHEIQFWGLSYVTFRVFHLLMDDALIKELNFKRYFLFVFYFPALLAGPIDRWPRFKDALVQSWRQPVGEFWPEAFSFLVLGLTQKFIFAEAVNRYALPASLHSLRDWVQAFYTYPLYLYLDFAGYSAMALGFSLLIGVRLPLNFNKPFLAANPQEFWQRFHISLGEWLRDYFFKPLYRASSQWPGVSPLVRQNISLFLTFLLMGLWNGFQKQYILSGSLFGLYSVVHNTFVFRAKQRGGLKPPTPVRLWLSRVLMWHLACLALLIFSGLPFTK